MKKAKNCISLSKFCFIAAYVCFALSAVWMLCREASFTVFLTAGAGFLCLGTAMMKEE